MQFTVASTPFSAVIASVSPPQPLNSYPGAGVAVMVSVVDGASCTTFVETVAAAATSPSCTVPPPSTDTVTVFNREVRQFPTNLIAKLLGFAEKDYLKVEAAKTEMPSMKI